MTDNDSSRADESPIAARINHDRELGRLWVAVDGVEAELDYRREGDLMTILHTGVPPAIGGRGIGGELVRAALEFARGAGWKVRPACSYADAWMRRHPEYEALRA